MISIFAKPAHYYKHGTLTTRNPHLYRTSSLIRGEQIAEYLGCKLNPTEGYEDDTCIYVKPNEHEIESMKDGSYVDVIDAFHLIRQLRLRPRVKIIATSEYHYDHIKSRCENEVVLIPHHHCNLDREVRTKDKIDTVGYIGSIRGIDLSIPEITEELKNIGLNFITNYDFRGREDSVNFYKQVDIQLVWKPDNCVGHTPMKVVNAASYGIPSVSKKCDNYREIEGFYDAVNREGLIAELERLKDPAHYASWSEKLIPEMEKYHISNIAKLYEELEHLA